MADDKRLKFDPATFCVLPYNSLSVGPNGVVRVCCNNYEYPRKDDASFFDFNDPDLDVMEALNSSFHRQLRTDLRAGVRHPSCHRCWAVEDRGGQSYRQSWNQYFDRASSYLENVEDDGRLKTVQADYVEITLGNKCNLKCRMCNPYSSVQWVKEARELGLIEEHQVNDLRHYNWFEKPKFQQALQLLLKHTTRLNILGGEPLMIEEQFEILRRAIDLGRAGDMEVQYNTNLTRLDPELLDLWSHFKRVFLNVSVDGYGSVNEYIRHPMRWPQFTANLETLREWRLRAPLEISLHCTFQALNVQALPELYDYVFNLDMGFLRIPFVIWVNYPEYLDARVLPRAARLDAFDRNMDFINRVATATLSPMESQWLSVMKSHVETLRQDWPEDKRRRLFAQFVKITEALDEKRKEKVESILPQWKLWTAKL